MVFLCSCGGLIWENRVHVCGTSRCSCGGIQFDGRAHCCGYEADYSKPPTDYELWRGLRSSDEWMGSPKWGKRSSSLFNTRNQETGVLNTATSMEEIRNLQHTGSFQDYCNSFDFLLTKVVLSEDYATNLFLGGLKPEIKGWVKFLRPKTLEEAYEKAKNQVNFLAIFNSHKEVDVPKVFDEMPSMFKNDNSICEKGIGPLNQDLSIQESFDSDDSKENEMTNFFRSEMDSDMSESFAIESNIVESIKGDVTVEVGGDDVDEMSKKVSNGIKGTLDGEIQELIDQESFYPKGFEKNGKGKKKNQVHVDFCNDVQEEVFVPNWPKTCEVNSEAKECYSEQCLEALRDTIWKDVYMPKSVWTYTGWNGEKPESSVPMVIFPDVNMIVKFGVYYQEMIPKEPLLVFGLLDHVIDKRLLKIKVRVYMWHKWKIKLGGYVRAFGSTEERCSWKWKKQLIWTDTSWVCNLKRKSRVIMEFKFVVKLVDKNRGWQVGLFVDKEGHMYQMLEIWNGFKPTAHQVFVLAFEKAATLLDTGQSNHLYDLMKKGNKALRDDKYEGAVNFYLRAHNKKPDDPVILIDQCVAYCRIGRFLKHRLASLSERRPSSGLDSTTHASLAMKVAEQLVNLTNNSVMAYNLKANSLVVLEKFELTRDVILTGLQIQEVAKQPDTTLSGKEDPTDVNGRLKIFSSIVNSELSQEIMGQMNTRSGIKRAAELDPRHLSVWIAWCRMEWKVSTLTLIRGGNIYNWIFMLTGIGPIDAYCFCPIILCSWCSVIGLKLSDGIRISTEFWTYSWCMYQFWGYWSEIQTKQQVMHNVENPICVFPNSSMEMTLLKKWPLYFSTKNAIMINYDGRPKHSFQEVYKDNVMENFEQHSVWYEHKIVKGIVAYAMKTAVGHGGFSLCVILEVKNLLWGEYCYVANNRGT